MSSKRDINNQLARQERHLTHIRCQQQAVDTLSELSHEVSEMDGVPKMHHILSHSQNNVVDLRVFLRDLHVQGDPAIKVIRNTC